MVDIITQRASLVGQVIEDLTYEPLEPGRFKVELPGVEREPQYKPGGFFVFSDLPPGSYALRIFANRFQTLEHPVTIPSPNLVVDSPGDNEMFVIVRAIDSVDRRITFDPITLSRGIQEGASVWSSSGFSTTLAAALEISRATRARLDVVAGLVVDSIVRIRRDRSIRLKFDPYYLLPSEFTVITGRAIVRDPPGSPPDVPKIPLEGARIHLTHVDNNNIVLNNIAGVNIATVNVSGTQTILGAEKDITTLTNPRGDYILYLGEDNLPASFSNVTLQGTLSGYQPIVRTVPVNRGQRNMVELQLEEI